MDQLLPPLFIAIAALALCGAIYAVWQSLRGLFAADIADTDDRPRSARARLVDEKHALLQTLKDIAFERDLGKISDQDYDALNARYRSRAKQVLRNLDEQLGPYRGAAAALVADVVEPDATDPKATSPDEPSAAAPTEAQAPSQAAQAEGQAAPGTCPSCQHKNAPDAVFCNQCGARIAEAPNGQASDGQASDGDHHGADKA